MTDNTSLKSRIMRRVYIVSYMRMALSLMAVKLYAIALGLWQVGQNVFVARVLENSPGVHQPLAEFSFFAHAFTKTEIFVQILVLGLLTLAVWLVFDFVHRFRSHQSIPSPSFI